MERPSYNSSACRHTNHKVCALPPSVVQLGRLVANLSHGLSDKVAELHFNHCLESLDRQPHPGAYDCRLAQRRVSYTLQSEAVDKAVGRFEHSPVLGNILPHKHEVFVALHSLFHAFLDRINQPNFAV